MVIALANGCAGHAVAPPAPGPAPENTQGATKLTPPPLSAATGEVTPTNPTDPRSSRAALRRSIFDAAWTTVRDKHYDKNLGGVDWNALRAKYEPLAIGAPDEPTF